MPHKITESQAFYAVAGAGDLAVEKLRRASKFAQSKLADLRFDPTTMSKDLTGRLDNGLATVRKDVKRLPDELKHLPEEFKTWSEHARSAAEKARATVTHTYGELAERGRGVVERVRSGGMPELGRLVVAGTTESPSATTEPADDTSADSTDAATAKAATDATAKSAATTTAKTATKSTTKSTSKSTSKSTTKSTPQTTPRTTSKSAAKSAAARKSTGRSAKSASTSAAEAGTADGEG